MKRVVITGMAGITSLGETADTIIQNMLAGKNGIRKMPEWDVFTELQTRLGAPVCSYTEPAHYTRKIKRSMGRVALLATITAENALRDAGLWQHPILTGGQTGVAYGSSAGSIDAIVEFGGMLLNNDTKRINATSYIRMMGHTTAVNISVYLSLKGLTLPTSSACTSGSMAIGQAFEAIRQGKQTVMIAGGADELNSSEAAVFDVLYATSCSNDAPETTPRPFDKDRDGLVIGEGAASLILEELEHAQHRNAPIYAEIIGYGSNTDGTHITQPNQSTMAQCMRLSLADAGLTAEQIDFVSAHGTATDKGDIAESQATAEVLGFKPIHSLKSYFGHTLGACGAIEAWLAIEMMRCHQFVPTLNLNCIDEACGKLDYLVHQTRQLNPRYVMSNNFAFGGINTSLIFKNILTK